MAVMPRLLLTLRLIVALAPIALVPNAVAEPGDPHPEKTEQDALREALQRLKLPGVNINVDEWSVDVDAVVTLHDGLLELIACTKDSKEHESLVAVNAKPSHIHTALLLIGANPGNPAMRQVLGDGEDARFVDLPPRGGMIDVFLVIDQGGGPEEIPINRFIHKASEAHHHEIGQASPDQKPEPYPTHSFMFTGSVLVERGEGEPRQYVADYSGNVISLVTFGDELLSTPSIEDDANHSLVWEVRSDGLPAVDSAVTLRLKPRRHAGGDEPGTEPSEKSRTE